MEHLKKALRAADAEGSRGVARATEARLGLRKRAVGGLLSDTWTFDGAAWTRVATATAPSARQDPAMGTLGDRIVLFGGIDERGTRLGDTWTFDGTTWSEVAAPTSPPARSAAAAAYLP
jgi:hypothetical protein